jgi:hypothetical protein
MALQGLGEVQLYQVQLFFFIQPVSDAPTVESTCKSSTSTLFGGVGRYDIYFLQLERRETSRLLPATAGFAVQFVRIARRSADKSAFKKSLRIPVSDY